jgi:hypothetical protein
MPLKNLNRPLRAGFTLTAKAFIRARSERFAASEPFLRIRLWLGNVVRANPDSGTVIFKANFPFVALFALE